MDYIVGTYYTDIVDSLDEALSLIESRIEDLDSTGNTIIGSGVLLTRRDRQQAIGWLMWSGMNIYRSDLLHTAEGDLVLKEWTVCADGYHLNVCAALTITQDHFLTLGDAYHIHACEGNLVLSQEHNLTVASPYHVNASDNIVLSQLHDLVVEDAFNAHAVENVVLNARDLVLANAYNEQASENLKVTTNS